MWHLLEYVAPTELTWVFGLGTILAIAMGFATGANDVANTFGTSVGSGALTLKKALLAAAVFEFAGAIALGSRVAKTIKSDIAIEACFVDDPSLYMIGMMAALAASATWLIVATIFGWPVSTTHSIVGGIVGMAMVLKGPKCVNWGLNGVAKIAISWVTSPLLAGFAAFCAYSLIVFVIFRKRSNPERRGLIMTPFLFAISGVFLEIMIIADQVDLPVWGFVIVYAGTFIMIWLLVTYLFLPWLSKVIQVAKPGELPVPDLDFSPLSAFQEVWNSIKSLFSKEGTDYAKIQNGDSVQSADENTPIMQHNPKHSDIAEDDDMHVPLNIDNSSNPPNNRRRHTQYQSSGESPIVPKQFSDQNDGNESTASDDIMPASFTAVDNTSSSKKDYEKPSSPSTKHHGDEDGIMYGSVSSINTNGNDHVISNGNYNPDDGEPPMGSIIDDDLPSYRAKQIFWWLQNFTACLGSFAHGANDTANAIGPFAAIYFLWKDGAFSPTGDKVPIWIVAIGGASIVLGLAVLGYRVIQTMGKELIHIDYVSGFSSELSSSLTVVVASRLNIPVSSTHCQVGAIVGVGLVESRPKEESVEKIEDAPKCAGCMSRLKQVNWKVFAKIGMSWIITVPVSALLAAGLAALLRLAVTKK